MRRSVPFLLVVALAAGALVSAVVPASSPAGAAVGEPGATVHPRLLFTAADVPGIRASVTTGTRAAAWGLLQRRASAWSDPTNPAYIDPALVGDPTPFRNPDWAVYHGIFGQNAMGTILADLGFAYVVSGDERYGRHAIELLKATGRNAWRAWNGNELGEGDLTKGVGLAFDWTYDLMAPAERAEIVESLTKYRSSVFSCLSETWYPTTAPGYNWQSVCGGGNGLALLAIHGEPGAPADIDGLLDIARKRILQTFSVQMNSGGDWDEGLNYMSYGMHNALPFAFAWERERGEDLLAVSPGIANVARHLAFEQLPGRGTAFVPRNDSPEYIPSLQAVIPLLFEAAPSGVVGWVWDRTVGPDGDDHYGLHADPAYVGTGLTGSPQCNEPTELEQPINIFFCWNSADVFTILYWKSAEELPRTSPSLVGGRSHHYPEHGLVDMRTGFEGDSDVVATYEAKHSHLVGHSQADVGTFTLYGHGSRFALDSGYGHNYSCNGTTRLVEGGCPMTDNGNGLGHNLVMIDGARYTHRSDAVARKYDTIRGYLDSAEATVVRSDVRASYATDSTTVPEARRDLVFSRPQGEPTILAVRDSLQRSGGSHTYQWRMHTEGANVVLPTGPQSRLVTTPAGATMALGVAEATSTPVLGALPWHLRSATPTQQYLFSQTPLAQRRFDHLAVMAVSAPGAAPAVATPEPASGGTVVRVSWLGGESVVASRSGASPAVTNARVGTDAEMAQVSAGSERTVLSHGTWLDVEGVPHVRVAGGPGTVSLGANEIVASGPAGATFRVRAPSGVRGVTLNGAPVEWVQQGPDVVFPRPDFALSVSPAAVVTKKNTAVTADANVHSLHGFADVVSLDVTGLPEGVTASWSPSAQVVAVPGGTATATVHLLPGPAARPGTYDLLVTATGDGRTRSAPLRLEVLDDDLLEAAPLL